jgi:hypothetical protein
LAFLKKGDHQLNSLSIQEKIELAHSLYGAWEHSLRQDPVVEALLHRLRSRIETTAETMLEVGVVAECRRCEEEEGGSCCGEGIENRYKVELLLMNLLLGVALPSRSQCENSCYLLGKNGCTLMARHTLCVNYICSKLQNKLTRDELIRVQTCVGDELDTGFLLHETIKKRIRGYR